MAAETLYGLLEDQCVAMKSVLVGPEGVLEAIAGFRFSGNYPGFSGHFPGNPILPAIVQLAMVRYTAERAAGRHLIVLNYSRTKFRNIIRPEALVEVSVRMKEADGRWTGSFSLSIIGDREESVATGNCLFVVA